MIKLHSAPMLYQDEVLVPAQPNSQGREKTMTWGVLKAHNTSGNMENLSIKFDAMASHDITYVGIIQTARASGLKQFPLPYVLTNCHNSLCAVGGTINEDDHMFGLAAAKKYGGEYVPAHQAVIHQYMRECYAGTGKMILCSDSHTRYGPYGTLAVGEGGPELVKQLLGRTWDIPYPDVAAVYIKGSLKPGVGPQDAALAVIGAVYENGFVKNKVLEFIGPGIDGLSMDIRNGIDVMTTETTCLSSIWETDEVTRRHMAVLGREDEYKHLSVAPGALYDCAVEVDLSAIEPMIALPFHPSRAYTIREFNQNAAVLLHQVAQQAGELWQLKEAPRLEGLIENGRLRTDQGYIGGCAGGTWQNIRASRDILKGHTVGTGKFALSVYPASQPMMMALTQDGTLNDLMAAGASIRSAFCGPCFGAGDVPFSGGFSIRHATRNFQNREGSKPGEGQTAYVALMDARSIAATAARGGLLTGADELPGIPEPEGYFRFDDAPYRARVYRGVSKPLPQTEIQLGPNITDWPKMQPLPSDITITIAAALYDSVTTTDELIPSGDTSSYRSNPIRLSEFALSRRDPRYVQRCKEIGFGSAVAALRPGDGSAREQAASCQRVLGGIANIALEYATKRYRSNLINWGMLPFIWDELDSARCQPGDTFAIHGIRHALENGATEINAVWKSESGEQDVILRLPEITDDERAILLDGCLMNHYAGQKPDSGEDGQAYEKNA
ncbi:MAG: hydratase [Oscillospiraceae bacterium]|nr:hydratase [Oscillospiraceae bacterium]